MGLAGLFVGGEVVSLVVGRGGFEVGVRGEVVELYYSAFVVGVGHGRAPWDYLVGCRRGLRGGSGYWLGEGRQPTPLRGGVGWGGFDLFDLEGVAIAVLAEEDEPLVAIEVAEGDVGEEVVAQVGLGVGGEGDGLGAGFAELGD